RNSETNKLKQESMDIIEIRKAAVNEAIRKKDYNAAKKLIAKGIEIAEQKKHPGTVSDWKKMLLEIAAKEKDTEAIRNYAKYFALDGVFSAEYYNMWKETYPPAEWKEVIDKHIEETLQQIEK